MTERVDVAVVGAGPAGLQAAIVAAQAGARVALIDSYPRPGGQYFKQPPAAFRGHDRWRQQAALDALLAHLARPNAQIFGETLVWGAFAADGGDGWLLALHGPAAPHRLHAQALILAAGAYDRPIPFPGWTLPGVMAAGGVQTLIKGQRLLPGRRVLLSGSGPLQLAVAAALVHAGADVVAVLEGSALGFSALKQAPAAWGQWSRLAEGWGYLRTLRAAGAPLRRGWAGGAAHGQGEVQEAVIARLDADWRPIPGTAQTLAVDTIVIGYGFIPSTELSRLLGCEHDFVPEQGGYVPRRDDEMQTTLPGVFAVGDGAGIGGAALAQIEGRIAGIAAAHRLGFVSAAEAEQMKAALRPHWQRERRFAAMLGRLFTPGPGLYTLADDDTTLCRCEEVTVGQVRAAAADGVQSVNELKGLTRAGMGNCQGRICGELAARLLADAVGADAADPKQIEAMGRFTVRPPIHPLPLSVLAAAAEPTP